MHTVVHDVRINCALISIRCLAYWTRVCGVDMNGHFPLSVVYLNPTIVVRRNVIAIRRECEGLDMIVVRDKKVDPMPMQ